MAFANLKLENLPRRIQIGVVAAIAIGIVAVAYMFYFRDLIATRVSLQKEVAQLEKAVAQATAIESQLGQFKRELAGLNERLNELRQILPSQKETPDVLRAVQMMAAESRLKIVRFAPQPVSSRGFYSDWPIAMEVQGSYNALGSFLEKVGQFMRIVNVDNVIIKGIDGSTDPAKTLNSSCTATTFVYVEDQAGLPGK
jgi:Tfp pilus assembly protein PilO